ncbi:MAG: radical SAM family heme chaperone HemW, partial [Oscillospiraceae bacterium]|nr:radical SAM family heme chaperone HemW [Oscillospiraceae bacterium]
NLYSCAVLCKKCNYCDFFSVPYQKQLVENYVQAIIRNIKYYALENKIKINTIYFGGGTPSLLSIEQITRILNVCAKYFILAENLEITLEYNPSGNRKNYLHDLRVSGVNRLSIGTQSFSDKQLKLLTRTHSVQDNFRTVLTAYEQGFINISCDLILATPYQDKNLLAESLNNLISLPITHCSAYLLQIEEQTALAKDEILLANLPDDDISADLYLQTIRVLESAGFQQYEISSFAKSGFESQHNLKYWHCEPYLGIGAGAHSCYQGRRFFVPKDIQKFCNSPKQEIKIISETACDTEEKIMLGLRTKNGIPENMLNYQAKLKIPLLVQADYLTRKLNGNIALTPKGFAVSNAVISELL